MIYFLLSNLLNLQSYVFFLTYNLMLLYSVVIQNVKGALGYL